MWVGGEAHDDVRSFAVQEAAAAAGAEFLEVQLRASLLWLQHSLPQLDDPRTGRAVRESASTSSASPPAAPVKPSVVKVWP